MCGFILALFVSLVPPFHAEWTPGEARVVSALTIALLLPLRSFNFGNVSNGSDSDACSLALL